MSSSNDRNNQRSTEDSTHDGTTGKDTNDDSRKAVSVSTLDILVDRMTRRLVRRYHLDEKPISNDDVQKSSEALENTNQHKGLLVKEDVNLTFPDPEDSPSVGDEMLEYRQYGVEVANQIREIIQGNGSKELALARLLNYVNTNEDDILLQVKSLASKYIQRESQFDNEREGSKVVLSLLQNQRTAWLCLPQMKNPAPWGLAQYIDIRNTNQSSDQKYNFRGEWARDKLLSIGFNWLNSANSKDNMRPFILNTIKRDDVKSIHNLLRKRLCDTTLPGSKDIVSNAMRDGILRFLDDNHWRAQAKWHTTQYIQKTYGGK